MSRRTRRSLPATILAGCLIATTTTAAHAVPELSPGARAPKVTSASVRKLNGKVIVKFKVGAAGAASPSQDEAIREVGKGRGKQLTVQRRLATGAALIDGAGAGAELIAADLNQRSDVLYAEPDRILRVSGVSNDPLSGSAWDLLGSPGIDITRAWTTTRGAGAVVAVVDTGILPHPDLDGQVLPGYDMISDPGVSNDGNGRDADPSDPGDWCTETSTKSSWHGTHVAGTIAAVADNQTGVAGVAPRAKVVPVRALGTCGGFMSDVADGILWAAGATLPGASVNANKADVINLSLGGPGTCSYTEQHAINAARVMGAVVVTAAGNSSTDASSSSPGNCTGVVNVAAIDSSGNRAWYSNYGSLITLAAPGSNITSTSNTGEYGPGPMGYVGMSGTSMAAPHVAGVAALIKSAQPGITSDQAAAAIRTGVKPFVNSCSGCGAGLLDAGDALDAAAPAAPVPVVSSLVPASGPTSGSTLVTISGKNFNSVSSATVGGATATVQSRSDASVTIVTPPRTTAGAVAVALRYGSGSTLAAGTFTYTAVPLVSALSPRVGSPSGGTAITITGRGFTGATAVRFGDRSASFQVVSDTSLTAIAPPLVDGSSTNAYVTVATPNGTTLATARALYTYAATTPTVTALSVRQGNPDGGNAVTVTGRYLSDATKVTVGGAPVDFSVASDTTLTLKAMPAMTPGTPNVYVVVANRWKSSTSSSAALYRYVVPVPQITGITPRQGSPLGGPVTVVGRQLTEVTKVLVGSTDVVPGNVTATSMTLTIPPLPDGVANGNALVTPVNKWRSGRGVSYRYVVPVPQVKAMTPRQGSPLGGQVVLTGRNFDEVDKVTVGDRVVDFVKAADNTTITLTVPPLPDGQTAGSVTVVPHNRWTAGRGQNYRYLIPTPRFTLSQTSGAPAGGAQVTLAGRDLDLVNGVWWGSTQLETFDRGPDGRLQITVPEMAFGAPTSVRVTVSNPWRTSRAATYRYQVSVPYLASVGPKAGPASGGQTVTLTGRSLSGVTTVRFGSVEATGVTVLSPTQVSVVVPAVGDARGVLPVTVATEYVAGRSAYGATFTYLPAIGPASAAFAGALAPLAWTW